jgi:hypothetical protein
MNANDEMASTLKLLKSEIDKVESGYEDRLRQIVLREKNETSLNSKIDELASMQGEILTFNIGGELMTVSKFLVVNSIYENILKDVVVNIEKIGRSTDDISSVFIDRNPKSFYYITEILRKSYYHLLNNTCLKVKIPNGSNIAAFHHDLIFYFKEDVEKVLADFEITNGVTTLADQDGGIITKFTLSTAFPNKEVDRYRAKSGCDIKRFNSNKAFFVNYNSTLDFEFKEIILISSLEVKPFTSNLDNWVPTEGAGTFIFSSIDNTEWDFLAAMPDDYGQDISISYFMSFDPRMAKYLRFQTGDYTLSISYLKINTE